MYTPNPWIRLQVKVREVPWHDRSRGEAQPGLRYRLKITNWNWIRYALLIHRSLAWAFVPWEISVACTWLCRTSQSSYNRDHQLVVPDFGQASRIPDFSIADSSGQAACLLSWHAAKNPDWWLASQVVTGKINGTETICWQYPVKKNHKLFQCNPGSVALDKAACNCEHVLHKRMCQRSPKTQTLFPSFCLFVETGPTCWCFVATKRNKNHV